MTRINDDDQHQRRSLVQIKIGDQYYDAIRERSCHTCMHPARMEIELALVAGHSYRSIERQYSDVEYKSPSGDVILLPSVSWQSLRNHFTVGHVPMDLAVTRQIAERRTQELGGHLDEMAEMIIDGKVFAQVVVQKAMEQLATGSSIPGIKEGLAAAKLLQDFAEVEGHGDTENDWREAMQVYFTSAQSIMDAEQWNRFAGLLQKNPLLRQLTERINEQRALEANR